MPRQTAMRLRRSQPQQISSTDRLYSYFVHACSVRYQLYGSYPDRVSLTSTLGPRLDCRRRMFLRRPLRMNQLGLSAVSSTFVYTVVALPSPSSGVRAASTLH